MTVKEIRDMKTLLGYSNVRLAEESGIPVGTVNKVLSGASAHPRYHTLYALWSTLNARLNNLAAENHRPETESVSDYKSADTDSVNNQTVDCSSCKDTEDYVRESSAMYQTQELQETSSQLKENGDHTIQDFEELPDDRRVELIDGYYYDLAAPSTQHQRISGNISYQFEVYIRSKKGSCEVFQAPLDVQLSAEDNKTVVQPDILVVCNPDIVKEDGISGAPDFIAEIVSPSSKRNDYYKKVAKYEEAGVREYWIIDPERKILVIYDFEQELPPRIVPLQGKVPVAIYNGELEINLDGWTF